MAILRATAAHATEIGQRISDFLGVTVPAARVLRLINDPNTAVFVDTTRHTFCAVRRMGESIEVIALFPRGETRTRLKPVLKATLQAILARFPATAAWRVYAHFPKAVGPTGVPDGGESECRAWQADFSGATVEVDANGEWTIWWVLSQAAA